MTSQNRAELATLKQAQGTLNALHDIACIRHETDKVSELRSEMTANWRRMEVLKGK